MLGAVLPGGGLITHNGGKTWLPLALQVINDKRRPGPTFVNEKDGFEVNQNILFMTKDSARHWRPQDISPFIPKEGEVNKEFFLNEKVGFAFGNVETPTSRDALVVKTEDGARTWSVFARIPGKGSIHYAFFIDENRGWIVTHQHPQEIDLVLHTKDGGKNWATELEFANRDRGPLGFITFADKGAGFVIGPGGRLFRRDE